MIVLNEIYSICTKFLPLQDEKYQEQNHLEKNA
jgi:hypothetical protein